jgi:hypothetical protein
MCPCTEEIVDKLKFHAAELEALIFDRLLLDYKRRSTSSLSNYAEASTSRTSLPIVGESLEFASNRSRAASVSKNSVKSEREFDIMLNKAKSLLNSLSITSNGAPPVASINRKNKEYFNGRASSPLSLKVNRGDADSLGKVEGDLSTALDEISLQVNVLSERLRTTQEQNVRLMREIDQKDVSLRLLEHQVAWLKVNHETITSQQSQCLNLQAQTIQTLATGAGLNPKLSQIPPGLATPPVSVIAASSTHPSLIPPRPHSIVAPHSQPHAQLADAIRLAEAHDLQHERHVRMQHQQYLDSIALQKLPNPLENTGINVPRTNHTHTGGTPQGSKSASNRREPRASQIDVDLHITEPHREYVNTVPGIELTTSAPEDSSLFQYRASSSRAGRPYLPRSSFQSTSRTRQSEFSGSQGDAQVRQPSPIHEDYSLRNQTLDDTASRSLSGRLMHSLSKKVKRVSSQ